MRFLEVDQEIAANTLHFGIYLLGGNSFPISVILIMYHFLRDVCLLSLPVIYLFLSQNLSFGPKQGFLLDPIQTPSTQETVFPNLSLVSCTEEWICLKLDVYFVLKYFSGALCKVNSLLSLKPHNQMLYQTGQGVCLLWNSQSERISTHLSSQLPLSEGQPHLQLKLCK